ncbi:MAG: hypothetical protein ACI3ZK_08015, partial [Candidatus Cryptobacteroides sp.]
HEPFSRSNSLIINVRFESPTVRNGVYAAKMALRYAYDLHRVVYDLHRKFGSEMAAKGSQKIDKNTPLTL